MNSAVQSSLSAGVALRRVAGLCAALMFVVVVASALLRHHGASTAMQVAWTHELAAARMVHRVAATLVLLGAVALVWMGRRAHDAAAARQASALLGIALLLSAVGLVGGTSRAAPVVVVNLLGGFAMLALCVRLAAGEAHKHINRTTTGLLALIVLQAAGGAIASTQASALCGLISDCGVVAVGHRLGGVLLALVMMVLGARAAWCLRRWQGAALALVALLILLVGGVSAGIGSAAIPLLVVVHNGLGAVVVALLVWGDEGKGD